MAGGAVAAGAADGDVGAGDAVARRDPGDAGPGRLDDPGAVAAPADQRQPGLAGGADVLVGVAQGPAASKRMRTSPAFGSSRSSSVISQGAPPLRRIAASVLILLMVAPLPPGLIVTSLLTAATTLVFISRASRRAVRSVIYRDEPYPAR